MVRIRLRRVGSKGQPSYRIVVSDSKSPRDGRFVEKIGFYNPRTQPETMNLNEERALYWLSRGAQPSDPVRRIMDRLGTTDRLKRLHAGEAMEALLAEAMSAMPPSVDPRTRRDDLQPTPKKPKKAAPDAKAAPAPTAEAVAEPPQEVEAEPVSEAEAVPAEEVEAEPVSEAEAVLTEEVEAAPAEEAEATSADDTPAETE